jgi:hypothetical protein
MIDAPILERELAALPAELDTLLQMPFPGSAAEPNDTYAWESWQTFFSHAPQRVIYPILDDYHNCEAEPPDGDDATDDNESHLDCDERWDRRDATYSAFFERCVQALTATLGKPQALNRKDITSRWLPMFNPDHPGFERYTPALLVDPDVVLFSNDRLDMAWWRSGERLVLLHYVGAKGDGTFQFGMSLCVLPDDGTVLGE